ncbi:helix-turn-helix domain-containing protein [Vibrio neonatus]|uniref:helix-turn-helix domain-containing protein n=1 Tax=Vibrio neonatus TaxID=278860 RepID=UPI0021C2FA9C|nr:AraC family transcriptional regulator [Vibrio neonatus]
MNLTVPLINKHAVIVQINALEHYIDDIWPIVHSSNLPIYLNSSSAKFVPFRALASLLQQAFVSLSHQDFKAFIRQGVNDYIKQISLNNSSMTSLSIPEQIAYLLPVKSVTFQPNTQITGSDTIQSLEFALEDVTPFNLVAELYAIVVVHQYLASTQAVSQPCKYHLFSEQKTGLDKLNISTHTPQFMGQNSTGIFYNSPEKPIGIVESTTWHKPPTPFSKQVALALECYIGRQDISINDFSYITGISPRSLQRYLKLEQSSFRKIKESLNMAFAKRVMRERDVSISDIAEHLGYADTSQFIRAFRKAENTTPLQWRKKACATQQV